MTRPTIFLDVETNGLDHRHHDAWEVAWWNLDTGDREVFLPYIEDVGAFLTAGASDDMAGLRVSRFVERWTVDYRTAVGYSRDDTQRSLLLLWEMMQPDLYDRSARAVVVCARPGFDLPFLSKLFGSYSLPRDPWWHRDIDLGSYACSKLDREPAEPPGAATVAEWCGIPPGNHTAMGDVISGGRSFLLLREFGRRRNVNPGLTFDQFLGDWRLTSAHLDELGGRKGLVSA